MQIDGEVPRENANDMKSVASVRDKQLSESENVRCFAGEKEFYGFQTYKMSALR